MKLLFIYFIALLLCLVANSESKQTILEEEVCTEVVVREAQIAPEFPALVSGNYWLKNYFLMLKALKPVKQLDLPSDLSKGWKSLPCKVLHFMQKSSRGELQYVYSAFKFMRLLSARHINGFYIYSLRELII